MWKSEIVFLKANWFDVFGHNLEQNVKWNLIKRYVVAWNIPFPKMYNMHPVFKDIDPCSHRYGMVLYIFDVRNQCVQRGVSSYSITYHLHDGHETFSNLHRDGKIYRKKRRACTPLRLILIFVTKSTTRNSPLPLIQTQRHD